MNNKDRSTIIWILMIIGLLTSQLCLVKTTPITMLLFFFIGLPAFGLGLFLYFIELILETIRSNRNSKN